MNPKTQTPLSHLGVEKSSNRYVFTTSVIRVGTNANVCSASYHLQLTLIPRHSDSDAIKLHIDTVVTLKRIILQCNNWFEITMKFEIFLKFDLPLSHLSCQPCLPPYCRAVLPGVFSTLSTKYKLNKRFKVINDQSSPRV